MPTSMADSGSPTSTSMGSIGRDPKSPLTRPIPLTSPHNHGRSTSTSSDPPEPLNLENAGGSGAATLGGSGPAARRPTSFLSNSPPAKPPVGLAARPAAPSPTGVATSSGPSATPAAPPPSEESCLFAPSLIPAQSSGQQLLPQGYSIRPLARTDHARGVLEVLGVLTTVGEISEESWVQQFDWMKARGDYYIVAVVDGAGMVKGTGAVVVERKFIHNLGKVGHIEDIAVAQDQQGKKLGQHIIETLDGIAKSVGCYKSILDCSEKNEGFYVKCGYERRGLEMAHYY